MQVIFSESEHLEGRPPRSPPSKRTTQPLQGAPGASRPAPSQVQAGAGSGTTGSSAASLGPAALHASGRLSLRFGPGDWAGSNRLAGGTELDTMGGVTHRRE